MNKYEISSERNAPTLRINGQNVPPVLYCLSDIPGSRSNTAQAQKNIKNFADAGIQLVSADTCLHLGWHKVSPFDPEAMREEIGAVLDANPNAKVFLRLHMNPPYWWLRDHPEECVVYRYPDGDRPGVDDGEQDRLIRGDGGSPHLCMRVSLASKVWISEAKEKLILFLESLKGTREGDALMAVQFACGIFGEWHQWGIDVSQPMQNQFREFLRDVYSNEENLRQAWNDPDVTFESAEFHPELTIPSDEGIFRDPQKAQYHIDSLKAFQRCVPQAILEFCHAAKETMPNLLCGSFYAYYLGVHHHSFGHFHPELLLCDPCVDFLCGPFCYYSENRASDGVPMQRALLESHRINGMLWLTEMDQHPVGTETYVGGDPARIDETVAIMRRNTLQTLLAGQGFWYYDHRLIPLFLPKESQNPSAGSIYRKNGWWERPECMQEIAKIQRVAEEITAKKYQPIADVLVVYDTESYYYRETINDEEYLLHDALARSGAVFDCIYKHDLSKVQPERYRCIIFANCQMLKPQDRVLIRSISEEKLCIFLNGCGYCDSRTLSVDNLFESIGMRFEKTDQTEFSVLGEKFRLKADYSVPFAIVDKDAQPLANWENGTVSSAKKGNNVYFPLPYLPRSLAKELLSQAGVHCWCDSGEPILAGAGFVSVLCQHKGERTLRLPNGKTIPVKSDGYRTPLYDIETEKLILE